MTTCTNSRSLLDVALLLESYPDDAVVGILWGEDEAFRALLLSNRDLIDLKDYQSMTVGEMIVDLVALSAEVLAAVS